MNNLDSSYLNAHYYVENVNDSLKIGNKNKQLDKFLLSKGISDFFIITAYNPLSVLLLENENNKRDIELKNELRDHFAARTVSQDCFGKWEERGFLVSGIDFDYIVYLASIFGQKSIVCGGLNKEMKIIETIRYFGNRSLIKKNSKFINFVKGWQDIECDIETEDDFLNLFFINNSLTDLAIKNFRYSLE